MTNTGLVTQRNLNTSWFLFLQTLLGSVFGLLGSTGFLMATFEMFYDKFHERIDKKKRKKHISKNNNSIRSHFWTFKIRKRSGKIVPALADESSTNF